MADISPPGGYDIWWAVAESLLIGLLVGAQRESARRATPDDEGRAGLRDFILIAATGCTCGFMQAQALTAVAGVGVIATLVALRFRSSVSQGYTTEIAAVAVFCLAYAAAVPGTGGHGVVAISIAVIVTLFLEARQRVHRFFRETLTEVEFADTIQFLALIFVIFPLLPDAGFGPFQFFNPHRIWIFVLLVSTISYLGYFLEKFLGASRGLWATSILGGLASTTAATSAFADQVREEPERLTEYWQAVTVANTIQFPRVLALVGFISMPLAKAAAWPLLAMTVAGLFLSLLLSRKTEPSPGGEQKRIEVRNPFSLLPALKFGFLFAAVVFVVKAASATFGEQVILWTGAIAGLIDVDAIALTVSEMFNAGKASDHLGVGAVLIALAANAVFKTGIAGTAGSRAFALRVGATFTVLLAAGGLAFLAL